MMLNLIKAELFKLKKNKSIWIVLLVMIVMGSISIFTGIYGGAENTFLNIQKDVMVVILALAIYCGVSLFADFQNRTILHYIVGGKKRSHIIIAQLIRYFLGCIVLVVVYPIFCTLLAGIVNGFETSLVTMLGKMAKIIFMGLPLYLSLASLFFMVLILVRQSVVAMGISVTSSIIMVVLTNMLYSRSAARESSIWRFSPVIELQILAKDIVTMDYFICLMCCIVLFIAAFIISKLAFDKAEIK